MDNSFKYSIVENIDYTFEEKVINSEQYAKFSGVTQIRVILI